MPRNIEILERLMIAPELPKLLERCSVFNLYFDQLYDFYVVNYNYMDDSGHRRDTIKDRHPYGS